MLTSPLPILLCGLALASNVAGQSDRPGEQFAKVREDLERATIAQLQSADLATVAWGGYAVAQFRLDGCAPEVRKSLARLTGLAGQPERCAAIALLDALIQTDARVPAAEMAPFADLGSAIVLMARDPEANRASLLHAFGGAPWMNDNRRACGNLLAAIRDPAFVLHLLRGPWKRSVEVADPRASMDDFHLRIINVLSSGASGLMSVPERFPPLACYTLHTVPKPGAVSVAPGPAPVFWARSWYRDGDVQCSRLQGYDSLQQARAEWLEWVLGEKQRPVIRAIDWPAAVEWKDRPALDRYVEQEHSAAEQAWRALVAACVEAKLLTIDPAKEPVPEIQFEYVDERTDKSTPLPPSRSERRK
jgi:hypothetical protein